ncbi:MAG: hypothetical protein JNM25_06775 [Planctomycetes bacterium]|nr:hypothetical protein [Planctomycetota bacterium]
MTRAARLLALLLVALPGIGGAARAQERSVVHAVDGREVAAVRVAAFPGASLAGGLGFLLISAENRDAAAHVVVVDVASHPWGSSSIAVRRELRLGPHELGRCFLPLPTTSDSGFELDVAVDGTTYPGSISGTRHDGVVGLLVSARSDTEPWGLTVVQSIQRVAKPPATVALVAPEDLPADWRLFTGFHAVVVDGRARLADEVQTALVRFATSGGTVVVGNPDRLPPGDLRARCLAADAAGVVRCGLGHCVVVATEGDTTELRERLAALPRPGTSGWPAPVALLHEQVVPGLGAAPVLVFLVVILVFACVAGPLNFLLLRRWRRPLLVLVTVPACGLGTTLLMLGYGLVHDGLGVRGVVRSWTLLDQERHEATSLAARTLFAGLSPDALTVAPDGMLLAPRATFRDDRRNPDRWQFDPVQSVLDGGVLPSRQSTPLLSARQGIARQRLRVRPAGDRLELLLDGGVVPVGEVLLHDADGRLWLGEAPFLVPATEAAARAALGRWSRQAAMLSIREQESGGEPSAVHGLVERLLGGADLPRGSYVARTATAPWLDDHGLRTAYDAVEHFVVGHLAAEDFVR